MAILTRKELAANHETQRHIHMVRKILHAVIYELTLRALDHDQSKLNPPEVHKFAEFTPLLAGSTFGSPEYKQILKQLGPALDHHYGTNRHHPEHFAKGISGMNIIDLVEMLCDWKAATVRHNDGDIKRSIEINAARFGLSEQLTNIINQSVEVLDRALQPFGPSE